jgi:hypothetical protein
MEEAYLDATVAYMNAVNKLMAWCERVRPAPNTPAYAEWAGERDGVLRAIAHYRQELADTCANDDAGMHGPIWVRLARGDFEDTP